jgi:hypothetical protein
VSLKGNQGLGTCTGPLAYGSSCKVDCATGFAGSGNLTVECTTPAATGLTSTGTCTPLPCKITVGADQVLGGCDATLAFGQSCTTTCNSGYVASASLTAACTTAPDSTIAFGDICDRMRSLRRAVIIMHAAKAFQHIYTEAHLVPTALPCTISLKANQVHGACDASGNLALGSSCLLECATNYTVSGSQNVTCATANDTSVQSVGTCIPKPCNVTLGANQVPGSCGAQLIVGGTCQVQCAAGFVVAASNVVACSIPGASIAVPDNICSRMVSVVLNTH